MYELTYRSKARPEITSEEIQDILEIAQCNNWEKNITGCLVFHKGRFIQILEGQKRDVLYIFDKLKNDIRHSEVEILWQGACLKRVFPNWNMAYHNLCSQAAENEIKLFEKNLSLLSEVVKKPTAATQLFWKNVNELFTARSFKNRSSKKGRI